MSPNSRSQNWPADTEIEVETLLQFIETCDSASESAQVMVICHWQNWMYYRQFTTEKLQRLEQNVHPYPIILYLREELPNLLDLQHIITQSYQPVDRAEEDEY